tara:strand:- start:648 stop:836 length:189 start_codon:yes stop_codon:yes gene_type:complete
MLHIKVSDYRDLEHALKILKKKVRNTKLTDSIRERRYFTKPSVTNRKKMILARYKNRKNLEE